MTLAATQPACIIVGDRWCWPTSCCPNLVVILFSFNKPARPLQLPVERVLPRRLDQPVRRRRASASRSGSACRSASSRRSAPTVLGTMVAFALGRYRFRGRSATNLLIFLPMATPEVVMGSSLLTLFLAIGRADRRTDDPHRAHHVLPVASSSSRSRRGSPRSTRASSRRPPTSTPTSCRPSCGSPFPLVLPGIAAGALLAFSLSFDDYIITNFNASPASVTFPMYVWGAAQRGTPVQINVIGTVMFLGALAVVVIGAGREQPTSPTRGLNPCASS